MMSRKLKDRVLEHIGDIRRDIHTNALNEYNKASEGHTFEFMVLSILYENVRGWSLLNRIEHEELKWILKLQADKNFGLNDSVPLKPYLKTRRLLH